MAVQCIGWMMYSEDQVTEREFVVRLDSPGRHTNTIGRSRLYRRLMGKI